MAHVTTPLRPKVGRHPAMWQSVPIGSFIQPSVSQKLVMEENSEHSKSSKVDKKDINDSKYFPPKKKIGTFSWNKNNRPFRNEDTEGRGTPNNTTGQRRANSTQYSIQKHHSAFSKYENSPSFHVSSPSTTFLSNEDDFPSLCSTNNSEVREVADTKQKTTMLVSTSYSEKLKHTHQNAEQNKTKVNNISEEKEKPQRNLIKHDLFKHDRSIAENRRHHPTYSTPKNQQDFSDSHWHAPHKIKKKTVCIDTGSENFLDQISPIQKIQKDSEREKSFGLYMNRENSHVAEMSDVQTSFVGRTEGSSLGNSFNPKSRNVGERSKGGQRHADSAKTETRCNFSPSLKTASKSEGRLKDEMREKCFTPKVPDGCENVPNSRGVGKVRTGVRNNTAKSSKVAAKFSATGEEREKHASSVLHSNQESATNSQQGSSAAKTPKKRKNRKSKLKRSLAFQTGKIMILTPELYSRFTGSPASGHSRTAQDFSFDLGDMEEYPELGQVGNSHSNQHKKMKSPEVIDSFTEEESVPTTNCSGAAVPKQVLFSDTVTSQEVSNASENISLQHQGSIGNVAKGEENPQINSGGIAETKDASTYKKPHSVLRKRAATPDPEKASMSKEKEPLLLHEQKTKVGPDGSFQISFSDILSSSMVKVKGETSKSRKQSDSRIKVISSKKVKMDKNLLTPNALDSSRPVVKRGKERERPKPKKHSRLKRIILKERSEKKLRRCMLVKQENLKNETSGQSEDYEDICSADKDGETETEVEAGDLDDHLHCSLIIEKCASELHAGENIDQNLSIMKAENESIREKSSEEIWDFVFEEKKMQALQIAVHTRRFREYCNHLLSAEIDEVTLLLLGDLTRFQDRLHQKDPDKARMKRRLVYGIKEVTKHLKLKKVKCVILAPDTENIKSKGGLNDAMSEIVRVSAEYHVPCVFALRKKSLGRACLKRVAVSCVGVFNYDGSEANFKKLLELQSESKRAYDAVMTNLKELIGKEDVEQLIEAQENSPQALQDLRTTILREKLLEKKPDLHLVFTSSGNVQLGRKEE